MPNINEITAHAIRECKQRGVDFVAGRLVGSREMGVASQDSDWDVRVIFKSDPVSYAKRHGTLQDFHAKVGDAEEVEIIGWDIKKFGELLNNNDPNAIEMCLSRTPLLGTNVNFDHLTNVATKNVNLMSLYNHYISFANSNFQQYMENGNHETWDRLFHIYRALCAARCCRRESQAPPFQVYDLIDTIDGGEPAAILEQLADGRVSGELRGEMENGEKEQMKIKTEQQITGEYDKNIAATDRRTRRIPDSEIDDFIEASFNC